MVLVLAWVAERVHPRVAGVLGGFPLGTALALLFMGIELSPDLAAVAAGYAVAGFAPAVVLMAVYGLAARTGGLAGVLIALCCGVLLWGLMAMALQGLQPGLGLGLALTVATAAGTHLALKHIPDRAVPLKSGLAWKLVLTRALVAAGLVLLVTWLAHHVSVAWAGTMAAFPMTFLPAVMLVHLARGNASARTMVKHYPAGLGALICYTLAVAWGYAELGLFQGTLLGFAVAVAWSWALLRSGQMAARSIQK